MPREYPQTFFQFSPTTHFRLVFSIESGSPLKKAKQPVREIARFVWCAESKSELNRLYREVVEQISKNQNLKLVTFQLDEIR